MRKKMYMRVMKISFSKLAVFAVALGISSPSNSMDMVEGGFAQSHEAFAPAVLTLRAPSSGSSLFLPQFGFTPRHRSVALSAGKPDELTVRLDFDANYGGNLGYTTSRPRFEGQHNLLVGGAIEMADIGFLGGVGRTTLFGERADLVTAGMSVGGVKARLSFGETAQEVQGASDVMMLSTDLHLAPWISLQGDVAVSERNDESEQLAVGRVGVKLRF